jgi:Flp pilus assembly protein TadB
MRKHPVFRRSKTDSEASNAESTAQLAASGTTTGKGRPTPTRKEAEAAARARAKVPRTRKEQMAQQRALRSESSKSLRADLKAGKVLLARDQGPVRTFLRDYVDSRFSFAEIVIPLMILSLLIPALVFPLFIVLVIDLLVLRWKMRRQLAERFPGEPLKGTTYYTLSRAMQMKFMRMPKPRVKIGESLPDHYR